MSDLGDLDEILKDRMLADLDWLDVDKDTYRAMEKLPQQNLDAVPELEEQWKHMSDGDMFRLSPENREVRDAKSPFWSERTTPGDLDEEKELEILARFSADALQKGAKVSSIIRYIQKKFTPRTIRRAARTVLPAVFKENGLLGNVYVDSALIPDCNSGKTTKNASIGKTAKYVKAKPECEGCVFNKGGRCSALKKELVHKIQYDEDLWGHYKGLFEAQGKNTDLDGIPVRARLQRAFLSEPKQRTSTNFQKGATLPKISYSDAQKRIAKKGQQHPPLVEYLKEAGGKELLSALVKKVGLSNLKKYYMRMDGKVAGFTKEQATKDAMEILSAVLDPNYVATGIKSPTPKMMATRMGQFLRDRMMKGYFGAKLAKSLEDNFSYGELLENLPVIVAFREEDGLYGRVYSTADSYSDCKKGSKEVPDDIRFIVKGSKCGDCVFRKSNQCVLYNKPLVDEVSYDAQTLENVLAHRVATGQLSKLDVEKINKIKGDFKTKARIAAISQHDPSLKAEHDSLVTGYYGKGGPSYQKEHEAVHAWLSNNKKATGIPDVVQVSKAAPSGVDVMQEFELGSVSRSSDVEIGDFYKDPETLEGDVVYDEGMIIDEE
jgi:hypothetical protein